MPAIVDLAPLAAVFFVVGMILLIRAFVNGLFSPFTGLPYIGGYIRSGLDAVVHALNSALGAAVRTAQRLVGASWHLTSRLTDWLWGEIKKHANLIAYIAPLLASVLLALRGIKYLAHHAASLVHSVPARFKAVAHEVEHLLHRVKVIEHDLANGIGNDVLPRIKSLDKELNKIRTGTIPAIEAADAQAASAISNLYDWAKGKASLVGVGTFAFAVAAVIGQEAFSLLRCSEFGGLWNKWRCGLWNLLDGLLGLVISALALENICTVLPILETAFGDVVGPVTHLLTEVPLGGCETPPKAWPQLVVAAGPRPPAQTLGAFPS